MDIINWINDNWAKIVKLVDQVWAFLVNNEEWFK